MGSLATADEATMKVVMQTLKKHNLYFVDSRTSGSSVAYATAQRNLVPAFSRDVFLDAPDLSQANLKNKVDECSRLALTKPYVVAITHCHSTAHLDYLKRFVQELKNRGFRIVPFSELHAYKLPEIM